MVPLISCLSFSRTQAKLFLDLWLSLWDPVSWLYSVLPFSFFSSHAKYILFAECICHSFRTQNWRNNYVSGNGVKYLYADIAKIYCWWTQNPVRCLFCKQTWIQFDPFWFTQVVFRVSPHPPANRHVFKSEDWWERAVFSSLTGYTPSILSPPNHCPWPLSDQNLCFLNCVTFFCGFRSLKSFGSGGCWAARAWCVGVAAKGCPALAELFPKNLESPETRDFLQKVLFLNRRQ